jgi:hypothetical protein
LAREAIKSWTKHQHFSTWKVTPDCRHGKHFIGKPCKKRADEQLKLGRHQLKMAVAILTGHAAVRGHLRTMGLFYGGSMLQILQDGDSNSAEYYLLLRGAGSSAIQHLWEAVC